MPRRRRANILRESALYFLPDRIRDTGKRTWTRWAKALDLWDQTVEKWGVTVCFQMLYVAPMADQLMGGKMR